MRVTRAEFERNLAAKTGNRLFLGEVAPMLAPGIAYDARAASGASSSTDCAATRLL